MSREKQAFNGIMPDALGSESVDPTPSMEDYSGADFPGNGDIPPIALGGGASPSVAALSKFLEPSGYRLPQNDGMRDHASAEQALPPEVLKQISQGQVPMAENGVPQEYPGPEVNYQPPGDTQAPMEGQAPLGGLEAIRRYMSNLPDTGKAALSALLGVGGGAVAGRASKRSK